MRNFGLAGYIKYDLPLKFRMSLSKLRCSAYNLVVETGRHNNIEFENRICRLCNSSKVEDEYHFIMEGPFYNEFRRMYLPVLLNADISLEMFYSILNGSKELVLDLSKYIYFSFEQRNEGMKALTEN